MYIGEQFSAARPARALYTHRNTILNRLQRAERLLPLAGHGLEFGVAPEIALWLGTQSGGATVTGETRTPRRELSTRPAPARNRTRRGSEAVQTSIRSRRSARADRLRSSRSPTRASDRVSDGGPNGPVRRQAEDD